MLDVVSSIDRVRLGAGFMAVRDLAGLGAAGVVVLDPLSTLVAPHAILQAGVTLWPNVIIDVGEAGRVVIGERSRLYPGTRIVAIGGHVTIGSDAEIGEEGGFTIKAEAADAVIEVGHGARLIGGGSLTASNAIGRGAQILGPIRAQHCRLGCGGTHREPDPDLRGGVLKGCGVARHLDVPTGMVVQAFGLFANAPMRPQSFFHPK